jgi:hypothetical protein
MDVGSERLDAACAGENVEDTGKPMPLLHCIGCRGQGIIGNFKSSISL